MGDCNNTDKKCQDLKRLGTIYLIINLINGKKYVGQTRQKLGRRISQHKCGKTKLGIDAAIKKYGWKNNFKVEILEECPVEKLDEREIFWIAELNTKAPNGYNLTDGGYGHGGYKPTPEHCANLSKSLKGRKFSEEHRKNLSKANKGRTPHNKGKHLSEGQKQLLSELNTGENHPNWGKHRSEETCKKIGDAQKGEKNHNWGKPCPQSVRDKLSEVNTGEGNPFYGKKHTAEALEKITAASRAYWVKKKAEKNLDEKNLENNGD